MNWITTNIRFPEDAYMELKIEAAQRRTSVAEIIRERVIQKKRAKQSNRAEKLMKDIRKLAKENVKYMQGVNLTKALIDMRYEQ